jgi:hypothetical protein
MEAGRYTNPPRGANVCAGSSSPAVILSEAKDLMPVASGDEVLRYAQDD